MKQNKGFIGLGLIVAIVLGIVVVGGGAYYLGKNSSRSDSSYMPDKECGFNGEKCIDKDKNLQQDQNQIVFENKKDFSLFPEESSTETFKNQPGEIKSIKADGSNKWVLSVDLLTLNPKWIPGGSEEVFLNQNTKIRNLNINNETKSYKCGYGPSGNVINNVLKNNTEYIKEIQSQEYKIRFFDISGINITAIYEQCLP